MGGNYDKIFEKVNDIINNLATRNDRERTTSNCKFL